MISLLQALRIRLSEVRPFYFLLLILRFGLSSLSLSLLIPRLLAPSLSLSDDVRSVWDASNGECNVVFLGHEAEVTALFAEQSKNADLVFSGDKSGEIRIWDITTESCLRTIPAHCDRVSQLSITPHGYLRMTLSFS